MPSFRDLTKTANPRVEYARQLMQLGLAGLGGGAAARAAMGFRNLGRPAIPTPFISPGPSAIEIHIPTQGNAEDPDLETPTDEANLKFADIGSTIPGWDFVANQVAKVLPEGEFARNVSKVPLPVMAAGAGLAGGWSLTDWILDKRRKDKLKDELETAQQDYTDALGSQYMQSKQAGDVNTTGELLDNVFDQLTKQGLVSEALGAYLLTAATLAGGAGYGTYQWAKGRSDAALLAKAQKERARKLWNRVPQPVYAVPAAMRPTQSV
jgi:hypothetical protein